VLAQSGTAWRINPRSIYMYMYMYMYIYIWICICICICNVCIHSLFNQLVRRISVFIRSLSLVGDVKRPEMGPVFPFFHAEFSVLPQSCNFHREIDDKTNGLFFLVMGFPNFSMCQLLHFFHFSTGTIHHVGDTQEDLLKWRNHLGVQARVYLKMDIRIWVSSG